MSPLAISVPTKLTTGTYEIRDPAGADHILRAIDELHSSDAESLRVLGVNKQLFSEFEETWADCGDIKIRYSWDESAQLLTVTMISPLHETIAGFVSDAIPTIRENLAGVRMCGEIHIEYSGVANCPTNKDLREASSMQPDAAIRVVVGRRGYYDANGKCPSVVAESVYSQDKDEILHKAWRWLWKTEAPLQVQAVILYEIDYPVGVKGKLRATLSVWVRDTTVREERYPVHNCRATIANTRVHLGKELRRQFRAPLEEATAEERIWPPNGQQKIRTRGGYITVVDEMSDDPWRDRPLILHTFDFARFCPSVLATGYIPQNATINIPVLALRESTLGLVELMRPKAPQTDSPKSAGTDGSADTLVSSWADICGTTSEESD
ncbi:hypothetical protein FS749_002189 [Ceratobasidium sp. UAMH 11750]|nr:hypothetical protein FS749_002189 [Ceratobasidium sp. UAMH 11750]